MASPDARKRCWSSRTRRRSPRSWRCTCATPGTTSKSLRPAARPSPWPSPDAGAHRPRPDAAGHRRDRGMQETATHVGRSDPDAERRETRTSTRSSGSGGRRRLPDKPFAPRARRPVKSILRRSTPERKEARTTQIRHGQLLVDSGRREVQVDGNDVQLAPKEFDLLWSCSTTTVSSSRGTSCWSASGVHVRRRHADGRRPHPAAPAQLGDASDRHRVGSWVQGGARGRLQGHGHRLISASSGDAAPLLGREHQARARTRPSQG